jgi:hypothetical protein
MSMQRSVIDLYPSDKTHIHKPMEARIINHTYCDPAGQAVAGKAAADEIPVFSVHLARLAGETSSPADTPGIGGGCTDVVEPSEDVIDTLWLK